MARFGRFRKFAGRARRFAGGFRSRFSGGFRSSKRRTKRVRSAIPKKIFGVPTPILLVLAAVLFFTPFGKTIKEKLGL